VNFISLPQEVRGIFVIKAAVKMQNNLPYQSLIVLPKYVGLIDCIDKSKNTKFTGLNTFYVGKQV
jgi:hypothetical protein